MAAYFVKLEFYSSYANKTVKRTCIITYNKSEKINEESFIKKVNNTLLKEPVEININNITDIIKL